MPRTVKKPKERKHEIIIASRDLFLEKGYENTTIQDVMKKLNIAKGTTYHYFKSKAELLESVISHMVEEFISEVTSSFKKCQGNALDKMLALVQASNAYATSSQMLVALHRPENIILHTRLLATTVLKLAPLYAQVIEQGCSEGIFETNAPLECAEFIISAVQFLTDIGVYSWSSEQLKRRTKAFPRLVEQQLKASSGSLETIFNKG